MFSYIPPTYCVSECLEPDVGKKNLYRCFLLLLISYMSVPPQLQSSSLWRAKFLLLNSHLKRTLIKCPNDQILNIEPTTSQTQCVYWNQSHPDGENQSDGRTETIDSNIFKSSQSNVWYKKTKSQLVLCDAYATTVLLINKLSSSNH